VKLTEEITNDIESMREWAGEDNWDSYNARAVTDAEILWAYNVIEELPELGDDIYFHIMPSSIEIDWGPVGAWFTLDSSGTGCLQTIDSHDPFDSNDSRFQKETDGSATNIFEIGQWFLQTKTTMQQMFEQNHVEFERWREVKKVDAVLNLGSFKPFTYFVWMVDNYSAPNTGFIWQNFRAKYAYSADHVQRSFFQCTQIIDMRTVPKLDF
jgi:hypothetical protein